METDGDDQIRNGYICLYASMEFQLLKHFTRFHLRI